MYLWYFYFESRYVYLPIVRDTRIIAGLLFRGWKIVSRFLPRDKALKMLSIHFLLLRDTANSGHFEASRSRWIRISLAAFKYIDASASRVVLLLKDYPWLTTGTFQPSITLSTVYRTIELRPPSGLDIIVCLFRSLNLLSVIDTFSSERN